MDLIACVEGGERTVRVEALGAHRYRVSIDGEAHEVDVRASGAGGMSLICAHRVHEVTLAAPQAEGRAVFVGRHRIDVETVGLRQMALRRAQAGSAQAAGPQVVRAPMPGRVVAVLVKPGAEVKKGTGLVVVEAMKMENELRAPRDGTVRAVNVEVGAVVDSGAPLCTVG